MKCGTLALVGRTNVGKSTLTNRLVQQKVAIVSDKPQTTRTRILGVGHFPAAQLVIVDTPGLHKPKHQLNRKMVRAALDTLPDADVVYAVVDATKPPGAGDQYAIDQVQAARTVHGYAGTFLVLNKVDEVGKARLLTRIDQYRQLGEWTGIVPISAQTGENVDRLTELTLACLPEDMQGGYDDEFFTDQTMRQMAAEIIREKVLHHTRAELPYAVAVLVDEFHEDGPVTSVSATIFVEKASQKAIVIGKQGQRLKIIGTEARHEMETAFSMKLFIRLWVKVRDGWRDNEHLLSEFGY